MLARSVYSDVVFVDALLRMGWVTDNCEHFTYIYILHLHLREVTMLVFLLGQNCYRTYILNTIRPLRHLYFCGTEMSFDVVDKSATKYCAKCFICS